MDDERGWPPQPETRRTLVQRIPHSLPEYARTSAVWLACAGVALGFNVGLTYGIEYLASAPPSVVSAVPGSTKAALFFKKMERGTYTGLEFMTRRGLARALNAIDRDETGFVRIDTSNVLSMKKDKPVWGDGKPYDRLVVKGIDFKLPKELASLDKDNLSLDEKLDAVWEHINKNFEYDAIPPKVGKKYPDMVSAHMGEKKAVCSGGNTLAALMLYNLEVDNIRNAVGTLDGGPHMLLEVNRGTSESPNWVRYDFTPWRTNPELEAMLDGNGKLIDWGLIGDETVALLPYALAAAVALRVGGVAVSRRRKFRQYMGELTGKQKSFIGSVADVVHQLDEGVEVYYGSGLRPRDKAFFVNGDRVILNRHRLDISPELVALGYAVCRRDLAGAKAISHNLVG